MCVLVYLQSTAVLDWMVVKWTEGMRAHPAEGAPPNGGSDALEGRLRGVASSSTASRTQQVRHLRV